MRPLLLAAALLLTVPAEAQVRLGVLANAGYDAGYGAASIGGGGEAGWTPPGSPVRFGVRVSGDYVFADDLPYAVIGWCATPPLPAFEDVPFSYETSVIRLGAEATLRWEAAPLPVTPYLKVGAVRETERFRLGGRTDFDSSAIDGVVGLGVVWRFVYLEGTYGGGDAGRERIAVGVTF